MPYHTPATRPQVKTKVALFRITKGIRLKNAIVVAFDGDEDLRKYHMKPLSNNKEMAFHTYRQIQKNDPKKFHVLHYGVYLTNNEGTQLIGFTTICKLPLSMLYSFGINHKFRTSEILPLWLKAIAEKFEGQPYGTVLNLKNTRAISFFERNGYVQTHSNKRLKIVSMCPKHQLTPQIQ